MALFENLFVTFDRITWRENMTDTRLIASTTVEEKLKEYAGIRKRCPFVLNVATKLQLRDLRNNDKN